MELISLKTMPSDMKIALINELGYKTDGKFILDNEGNKINDRYLDIPVELDNMVILPGSIIILDNNEYSIAKYIEEFGDVI